MSDLDPFDDELGTALRRRAGDATGSTAAAHDAVLRRSGAIRRRRAAIGGGGAMTLLLIGGIVLLPRGAGEIGPADPGDVLPTFEDVATTTPDESDGRHDAPTSVEHAVPTTSSTIGDSETIDRGPAAPETSDDATAASTTAPSSSSPTTSAAPTTSSPTTSGAPTTSIPSTSTPGLALDPFTDTYDSVGGSITVSWTGAAFALQAVSPASGFVADVEDSSATRVRVRFEGPDADSRIEVSVADGQLVVDID